MPKPPARRRQSKRGQSPGAPIYAGEPREGHATVNVIDFSTEQVREVDHVTLDSLPGLAAQATTTWVDVTGVHDVATVQAVCEALGVHALAMEDVLNPTTRVKIDDYGDHLLIVIKAATRKGDNGDYQVEQLALVLGPSWVASFQEREGDQWEGVRERIRHGRGRIRKMGPAYLLHALMDAVVDGYLDVLDGMEIEVEAIEEATLGDSGLDLPRKAHDLRGRLHALRRLVWPLREGLAPILRSEVDRVPAAVLPYFRDLADHLSLCVDILDGSRDRTLALVELHLAVASHRMNEVMKVLTIVATLFMPLTFIVGVYGMNFEHMPELAVPWAYPATLAVMLLIAGAMVAWFRRRGWL